MHPQSSTLWSSHFHCSWPQAIFHKHQDTQLSSPLITQTGQNRTSDSLTYRLPQAYQLFGMENRDFRQATGIFRASQSRIRRKRPIVSCSSCRQRKARCDRKQPCSGCEKRGEGQQCDFRTSPSHATLEVRKKLDRIEQAVQGLAERNLPMDAQDSHSGELTLTRGANMAPDPSSNRESHISAQLADLMWGIQGIRQTLDAPASPKDLVHTEEPDLIFGSVAPISVKEVLSAIPTQRVADRIISTYFNSSYHMAAPILHTHQFRRQYEAFWKDPDSSDNLWVSLLLSTLSIGSMVSSAKGLLIASAQTLPDPKTYITLSARCLVAGSYLTARPFSVEALIMHAHSRYIQGGEGVAFLTAIFGLTVRLAQGQGFHRDLGLHPATATPFQIEMRRRAWFMIQYYDLLFALEQEIPPLIHSDTFDTAHPVNLADDDFDEDSIYITPRPLSDPQPILACIYQSRLLPILRRVLRHSCQFQYYTHSDTVLLGSELEQWHASIPACLKARPIQKTSFTDPNYTVMNRVMLELLYNMALSILYRPFLRPSASPELLYDSSLDVCRKMALKSIHIYVEVHQELQLGGRLYEDRYMPATLRFQDFLIATIVLSLEFSGCPNLP